MDNTRFKVSERQAQAQIGSALCDQRRPVRTRHVDEHAHGEGAQRRSAHGRAHQRPRPCTGQPASAQRQRGQGGATAALVQRRNQYTRTVVADLRVVIEVEESSGSAAGQSGGQRCRPLRVHAAVIQIERAKPGGRLQCGC